MACHMTYLRIKLIKGQWRWLIHLKLPPWNISDHWLISLFHSQLWARRTHVCQALALIPQVMLVLQPYTGCAQGNFLKVRLVRYHSTKYTYIHQYIPRPIVLHQFSQPEQLSSISQWFPGVISAVDATWAPKSSQFLSTPSPSVLPTPFL